MTSIQWSAALLLAASLAACGGGGGTDNTEPQAGVSAVEPHTDTAAQSTETATSSAAGDTASGNGSSTSVSKPPGATPLGGNTYVGHWMGWQILSTPTRYEDHLNGGGVLMRFGPEAYGKLQAEGAFDALARWSGAAEYVTARLGVGFVGDLYADQNVYGWGTGRHLLGAQVWGRYDPDRKRLSLDSTEAGGTMGDTCKYCDGGYFTGTQHRIEMSPVGSAHPASLSLTRSGAQLQWKQVEGVQYWLVSVFQEDGVWGRQTQTYEATLALGQVAFPLDADGMPLRLQPTVQEFQQQALWPGTTTRVGLPVLPAGTRAVAVLTGFATTPPQVIPAAVAWSSMRWTAR